jgi:hypothetical protein
VKRWGCCPRQLQREAKPALEEQRRKSWGRMWQVKEWEREKKNWQRGADAEAKPGWEAMPSCPCVEGEGVCGI